jgi:hypothetical protein
VCPNTHWNKIKIWRSKLFSFMYCMPKIVRISNFKLVTLRSFALDWTQNLIFWKIWCILNLNSKYSFVLDVNNFEKFHLVTSEPFGGKIQNLTKKSEIYQWFGLSNKKYGYRLKNRSYLQFCPKKLRFVDVNNEKCLFLIQEKSTISHRFSL